MTLLEVRDLRVEFPGETETVAAVRGLNYTVAAGEVVALVGESGAGKSAGAMAVVGLLPETGRIAGGRDRVAERVSQFAPEDLFQTHAGLDVVKGEHRGRVLGIAADFRPCLVAGNQAAMGLDRAGDLDRFAVAIGEIDGLLLTHLPAFRRLRPPPRTPSLRRPRFARGPVRVPRPEA